MDLHKSVSISLGCIIIGANSLPAIIRRTSELSALLVCCKATHCTRVELKRDCTGNVRELYNKTLLKTSSTVKSARYGLDSKCSPLTSHSTLSASATVQE